MLRERRVSRGVGEWLLRLLLRVEADPLLDWHRKIERLDRYLAPPIPFNADAKELPLSPPAVAAPFGAAALLAASSPPGPPPPRPTPSRRRLLYDVPETARSARAEYAVSPDRSRSADRAVSPHRSRSADYAVSPDRSRSARAEYAAARPSSSTAYEGPPGAPFGAASPEALDAACAYADALLAQPTARHLAAARHVARHDPVVAHHLAHHDVYVAPPPTPPAPRPAPPAAGAATTPAPPSSFHRRGPLFRLPSSAPSPSDTEPSPAAASASPPAADAAPAAPARAEASPAEASYAKDRPVYAEASDRPLFSQAPDDEMEEDDVDDDGGFAWTLPQPPDRPPAAPPPSAIPRAPSDIAAAAPRSSPYRRPSPDAASRRRPRSPLFPPPRIPTATGLFPASRRTPSPPPRQPSPPPRAPSPPRRPPTRPTPFRPPKPEPLTSPVANELACLALMRRAACALPFLDLLKWRAHVREPLPTKDLRGPVLTLAAAKIFDAVLVGRAHAAWRRLARTNALCDGRAATRAAQHAAKRRAVDQMPSRDKFLVAAATRLEFPRRGRRRDSVSAEFVEDVLSRVVWC